MTSRRKSKLLAKETGGSAIPPLAPVPRRQPAGRLQETPRAERPDVAKATVLGARCVRAGIPDTLANRRAMDVPEAECAIGRAWLAQHIDRKQWEAAMTYAITDHQWRVAKGLPPLWPRAARMDAIAVGRGADTPERARAFSDALSAATGHVRATAGPEAATALREVAVMDAEAGRRHPRRLAGFQAATRALVIFYGLGG